MHLDFSQGVKRVLRANLTGCVVFLLAGLLASCASQPPMNSPQRVSSPAPAISPTGSDPDPGEIETEILDLENGPEITKSDVEDSEEDPEEDLPAPKPPKHGAIPFEFNQKVAEWVRYFSQKDRERFQRYLDRGEAYREVIEDILEQNRVPADLYYLGLIESGYHTAAKSSAKAVGVWQFMKATGKMYRLAVDGYVDERKDPIRATEAAAKYLRDLYREFGSWNLALAAYNAGPGRIRGAIRRGGTRDFWELVSRRKLPRETVDYVPKFLAARYIGERPDLFAFFINEEQKYPDVELAKVPSPVRFQSIEAKAGLSSGTLQFVNPHYLFSHTHPAKKMDEIWVPAGTKERIEAKFSDLSQDRIQVQTRVATRGVTTRASQRTVVVRRGQNLKIIARAQGLSVAYLMRVNGLKSSRIYPGQKLKVAATEFKKARAHPRKRKGRR